MYKDGPHAEKVKGLTELIKQCLLFEKKPDCI